MLNFNQPKTVASILSTFNKTIDQLKAAAEQNATAAADKTSQAEILQFEAKAHDKEVAYATSVAGKLEKLIEAE